MRQAIIMSTISGLALAACASAPPAPSGSLQAARQAIASAEQVDAGRYAPGDLGEARTKLSSADAAVKEEDMTEARWLADESRASAELATTRTAAAKAREVNDEMKRGTAALVEELQRNSGEAR